LATSCGCSLLATVDDAVMNTGVHTRRKVHCVLT
jgi:hypothetical protein